MEFKTTEKLDELFQKANTIKNRYNKAKEKAKEEAEQLKVNIHQAEADAHELYRMYVIGDIELSAYQEKENEVSNMKKMLQYAERKVADIDKLVEEELSSVFHNEINPIIEEYNAENAKNKAKQREKMFQAKVAYLKEIQESAKEIRKTDKYRYYIENLKVDIGLQANAYADLSDEALKYIHNTYNSQAGLDVTSNEISNAYNKKHIDLNVREEAGLK